jgi:hypothetical protein
LCFVFCQRHVSPNWQQSLPGSATMKDRFKAILITKDGTTQTAKETELGLDDLMDGDVTVAVSHSTVNYKDGLAITGRSPVVRKFPMIPGIDLAGTVETSSHPKFKPGDKVLLNGFGLSETHFGGYSEIARVKGDWLVPLPKAFSAADAMAIGTAGYTSMLCVLALEDAGVAPAKGPVVVTGAAGGVGSVAVALLAKLGYRVIASTGRSEGTRRHGDYSPQRAWWRSAAVVQGALGRRRGQRGLENARQCDRSDPVWGSGCGLRIGTRARSPHKRGPLHSPGHLASRHRIRLYADAPPPSGLGALGPGPRCEETLLHDADDQTGGCAQGGRRHFGRAGARPAGRRDRVNMLPSAS